MTVVPPPYPRIPRFANPEGDDLVVPAAEREAWLHQPVLVEEKLDGANVSIWSHQGRVDVAGRGGRGAMDRAGQLGRLRAWTGERAADLPALFEDGWAVYAEWLWLEHSVAYDALPDYLVVLDLWSSDRGFAPIALRDARAEAAGLRTPPRVLDGVLGTVEALDRLSQNSAYREGVAEGVVLRRDQAGGAFDRCKWVRKDFARRSDDDWRTDRRYNRLAG